MGTYQAEVWLSVSHPSGQPIAPETLAKAIKTNPAPYTINGLNKAGANVRLDVCQLNEEDFSEQEEPSEAFHAAVQQALNGFAQWLRQLPTGTLDELREEGFRTGVWAYCWIRQDQFEFQLPWELMTELGRLKLPMQLMSEGQ